MVGQQVIDHTLEALARVEHPVHEHDDGRVGRARVLLDVQPLGVHARRSLRSALARTPTFGELLELLALLLDVARVGAVDSR